MAVVNRVSGDADDVRRLRPIRLEAELDPTA